jgi:hypothetical protein
MKKTCLFAVLAALFTCLLGSFAHGSSLHSVKVTPYGVDYPLLRGSMYPSPLGEPFEKSFGVRRWLRPLTLTQDVDYEATMVESLNWFKKYSGYGVLGHGEDVFTAKAARFRMMHRGR